MSDHPLDQSVRITVCEFPDEQEFKERAWAALANYVGAVGPNIVILIEMPCRRRAAAAKEAGPIERVSLCERLIWVGRERYSGPSTKRQVFSTRARSDRMKSSFPRKRERASDERWPPVQARGRPRTPASAGATKKRFYLNGSCFSRMDLRIIFGRSRSCQAITVSRPPFLPRPPGLP